jgi:hypothetical protein
VRNIYIDEAGISAHEPLSVVVALLVHTDTQWRPAAQALVRLFEQHVPEKYREGFSFHAKDVTARNKYPDWDPEARRLFIQSVMRIPISFRIPIAIGAVKRGQSGWTDEKLTPEKMDYIKAFALCMSRCDHYLRTRCGNEMGQVIADDNEEMRRFLQYALFLLRKRNVQLAAALKDQIKSPDEFDGSDERVARIIDEVHFMQRASGSHFLQLADACAFGFRGFFTGHRDGKTYLDAILPKIRELPPTEVYSTYHAIFFPVNPEGKVWHPFSPGGVS